MTLMAIAALCAAAAGGGKPAPAGTDCAAVARQYQTAIAQVAPMLVAPDGRDAIARVAYAEAGNQGDSGLVGVVYTIVNRLIDGGFGGGVGAVLNAPGQFEPVTRAGGWQRLPVRSAVEQAHIDTILNLAMDGRLPDPTNGARYFQNPAIVAGRAAAGTVSAGLVNFGGQKPVAVIKDHAFFDGGTGAGSRVGPTPQLFVQVQSAATGGNDGGATANPSQPSSLFVPLDH
jgi:spore germination cell wall hydrolase CwlJ-like protein